MLKKVINSFVLLQDSLSQACKTGMLNKPPKREGRLDSKFSRKIKKVTKEMNLHLHYAVHSIC